MENIIILPCGLISRKNAAEYLGLKPHTLSCWNSRGTHDEYFKKFMIGGRVHYRFDAVEAFARRSQATANTTYPCRQQAS